MELFWPIYNFTIGSRRPVFLIDKFFCRQQLIDKFFFAVSDPLFLLFFPNTFISAYYCASQVIVHILMGGRDYEVSTRIDEVTVNIMYRMRNEGLR